MPPTVAAIYKYTSTPEVSTQETNPTSPKWGTAGLQLSTGNNNGGKLGLFTGQINLEGLYTGPHSLTVGVNGYAGAEYPIKKTGCSNWFTNLGVGAVAEAACEFEPLAKGSNHAGSIYGGGRAQIAWRGAYHEVQAGFRGGYKWSGSVHIDAKNQKVNVAKEYSQGKPVYGPAVSVVFCIPKTQTSKNTVLAGLWCGVNYNYNIPDGEHYLAATIGYSF